MTGSKSGVMLGSGRGKILENRSRLQDWSKVGFWKWEIFDNRRLETMGFKTGVMLDSGNGKILGNRCLETMGSRAGVRLDSI